MGNRLSKIVTRTGDDGTTGLGDGSRVAKDSPRIDAIGAVDELNSSLGVLLAESVPDDLAALLTDIQHDLFDLGGELSVPGYIGGRGRARRTPRGRGVPLQRGPRPAQGIHPAGRHAARPRWHTSRERSAVGRSARW